MTEIISASRPRRWIRRLAPWLGLLGILLGLLAIGHRLEQARTAAENRDLRLSIFEQANTLRARIEGQINAKLMIARSLISQIELDPDIPQETFGIFARRLVGDDESVVNIAFGRGLVVEYVHPYEPNKSVVGFDYRNSPPQLAGVKRAIDLRSVTLTGPVNLLQGFPGFVLRTPVFVPQPDSAEPVYWGIASVVLDAQGFYDRVLPASAGEELLFAIREVTPGAASRTFYGDESLFSRDPVMLEVDIANTVWQIAAVPAAGWLTQGSNHKVLRALYLTCVALLMVLLAYILHLVGRRRQAEERLSSAIEALDDGFAVYDSDDRFVTSNQRYRDLYKHTADLFKPGTHFEDIIRVGVARGQYKSAIGREEEFVAERLAAHRRADTEIEQQLDDGRWLRVSERRTADGSTVGFRVDITELKNAKEEAQRANKAKSDFFGVLSHELRTPLTIILGHAKILSQIEMVPQTRELISHVARLPRDSEMRDSATRMLALVAMQSTKIVRSGDHLLALINQMLDLSKVEAEDRAMDIEAVDVAEAMEKVRDQFSGIAEDKGVDLIVDAPNLRVAADPTRLHQIMVNLVGNAFKFTQDGQVEVRVETVGAHLRFSVIDTGCGIPEHELHRVFDEFHQVDSTATRRVGGTGLGLAITRELVLAMGGKIEVESIVGKGSRFHFMLAQPASGTALQRASAAA